MFKKLNYNYTFDSLYSIPVEFFKKNNIKNIFLDFDNTIVEDSKKIVKKDKKFAKWYKEIVKENIKIFIISNNKNFDRIDKFCQDLKIYKVYNSKKPSPFIINKIIKNFSIKKSQSIIIGDRLFTDILSGNNAKIRTILLKPIGEDRRFITKFLLRNLENYINNMFLKRKLKYNRKNMIEYK